MMTQEKQNLGDGIERFILELTIIPFLSTILYINFYQDSQGDEEVTQLLVSKKPILYSGLAWLLMFALSLINWSR